MTVPARLLVVALLLVGGCGGGEPSGPGTPGGTGGTASAGVPSTPTASGTVTAVPVPRTVTPADDGRAFTMPNGTTTALRVQDPTAGDPVVDGASVLVVPVVNVTDSGVREWELRAVTPGTTTLTGSDPDYRLTVIVR